MFSAVVLTVPEHIQRDKSSRHAAKGARIESPLCTQPQ